MKSCHKQPRTRKECKICSKPIFNRADNADYCKKHSDILKLAGSRLHSCITRLKQVYPEIKFKVEITAEKRELKENE